MRILLFFDLPTNTLEEKREYRRFRKFLLKAGFLMMQESVYCKLVLNSTVGKAVQELVRKNAPVDGLVQMMVITEKQFLNIEFIVGEKTSEVLDTDKRITFL